MHAKVEITISIIAGVLCLVQGQVVQPYPETETRTLGHLLGIGSPNLGSVTGGLLGSLVGGFLGAEDGYYGGGYASGYGGGYGGSPFIGGRPVYPKRPSGYHRTGYPYNVNYYEYSNVPPYYNRPYVFRK